MVYLVNHPCMDPTTMRRACFYFTTFQSHVLHRWLGTCNFYIELTLDKREAVYHFWVSNIGFKKSALTIGYTSMSEIHSKWDGCFGSKTVRLSRDKCTIQLFKAIFCVVNWGFATFRSEFLCAHSKKESGPGGQCHESCWFGCPIKFEPPTTGHMTNLF